MTRRIPDPENSRRARKFFRKNGMSHPVYQAHLEGEALGYGERMPPRLQHNPYPPGRRYEAWERAYRTADPLGDWHGRNY